MDRNSLRMKILVVFVCLIPLFLVTESQTTNNETEELLKYKTGNSKKNVDWFAYIKLFINIILPDGMAYTLMDYLEPIIQNFGNSTTKEEFNVEKVKEVAITIAKFEAGTCVILVFALIVALILPFFCLGCCCSCCCCTPNGASPKRNCSRRSLIFFFTVFLLLTLPAQMYLYFSSHKLNGLTGNVINRVDDFLDDAYTFIHNTGVQTTKSTAKPFDEMTNDIISELNDRKKTFGDEVKNSIIRKLEENLIYVTNDDFSNASFEMHELDSFWKSANFVTLVSDVVKFKNDVKTDYCSQSTVDCDASGVTNAIDNLPTCQQDDLDRLIAAIDIVNATLNMDEYIEKISKSFETISGEVESEYEKAIKDFKKNIFKLQDGVTNLTQQLQNFSSKLDDFKEGKSQALRNYNSSIDMYTNYAPLVTLGISSYVFCIWILFCSGLFIGVVFHNKSRYPPERSCGSNLGGCILMTTIIIMLSTVPIFWLLNSILSPVGSHVQQFICKPLYDEPEFKFIKRVMDAIPLNDSVITKMIPGIKTKSEILDILSQCENDTAIFKAFHLESTINLEDILDFNKYVDVQQELDHLTTINLSQFTQKFSQEALEMKNVLQNNKSAFDITEDKTINDCLAINSKVLEVTTRMTNSPLINEILLKLSNAQKVLQPGRKNWKQFKKLNISARIDSVTDGLNTAESQNLDMIKDIVKDETEKLAKEITKHGQKFVDKVIHLIKNDIGGCRPVWNMFDTSRAIFCKDIVDPINGMWFSLGFCLFFFLPMSIIACMLSKHFRRLPYDESSRSNSFSDDYVGKDYYPGYK